MSTRCNIVITDKKNKNSVTLYHHHDGYPEGVGVELLEMTDGKVFSTVEHLATFLMKTTEPLYAESENMTKNEFELTSGVQGDIDYLYKIRIGKTNCLTFECWKKNDERTGFDEMINLDTVRRVAEVETKIREYDAELLEVFRKAPAAKRDRFVEIATKYVPAEKWGELFGDFIR